MHDPEIYKISSQYLPTESNVEKCKRFVHALKIQIPAKGLEAMAMSRTSLYQEAEESAMED